MGHKKGYISFILFSLISIIILYPIFFYSSFYPLWPSFVLKDTFNNHVLQKRAIESSTIDVFTQLKPVIVAFKKAKVIKDGLIILVTFLSTLFPPLAGAIPIIQGLGTTADFLSSYEARAVFIKLTIFLTWGDLSTQWAENSNYLFSINCPNRILSSIPPLEVFKNLNLDSILNKIPFYLSCYDVLEYQDSPDPSDAGKLIFHEGVEVLTKNKLTNSTAKSMVRSFEVD